MATTPTFVEVINDLRTIKNALSTLQTGMDAVKSVSGNSAERSIAKSMSEVGKTLEKRIQEITLDVSKLAINYSKEDLDDIMKAMST